MSESEFRFAFLVGCVAFGAWRFLKTNQAPQQEHPQQEAEPKPLKEEKPEPSKVIESRKSEMSPDRIYLWEGKSVKYNSTIGRMQKRAVGGSKWKNMKFVEIDDFSNKVTAVPNEFYKAHREDRLDGKTRAVKANNVVRPFKEPSTSVSFHLAKGVSEQDLGGRYSIYAHLFEDGSLYVGRSSDPAQRWTQHYRNAYDKNSPYTNASICKAIRTKSCIHIILSTTDSEKVSADIEAAAMQHYKPALNDRYEKRLLSNSYDFYPLSMVSDKTINIGFRKRDSSESVSSSDHKSVSAVLVKEQGRKRLKVTSGIRKGAFIECGREMRNQFRIGDAVSIPAKWSEKKGCFTTRRDAVATKL